MLNRQIVFGVVVIAVLAIVVVVVLIIPEKSANCGPKDSVCPQGCTYANDADCLHSSTTVGGEIRRCLSDSECVIVSAICGNEKCNFNDASCARGCSCGVSVNKDYQSVFEAASTECLPSSVAACAKCPENITTICTSGECRIIT